MKTCNANEMQFQLCWVTTYSIAYKIRLNATQTFRASVEDVNIFSRSKKIKIITIMYLYTCSTFSIYTNEHVQMCFTIKLLTEEVSFQIFLKVLRATSYKGLYHLSRAKRVLIHIVLLGYNQNYISLAL